MAHAFIKGPMTLKPHALAKQEGVEEPLPVGADEALEVTLATWKSYWQDPEREAVHPENFTDGGDKLPPITVEMFDQACREISEGSGLSWENLHPRSFLLFKSHFALINAATTSPWPCWDAMKSGVAPCRSANSLSAE